MNSVNSVRDHFESLSDSSKRDILLYGDSRLDTNKNKFILVATINYIKHSERFSDLYSNKNRLNIHQNA